MLDNNNAGLSEVRSSTESSAGDRRDAVRHTLLIRSAKLIILGAEYLCILCDASETGAKVRFFHPLPDAPTVTLELQNEDQLEAEIVWRKGDKAGLRFLRKAEMARILEVRGRFEKRPVRVRLSVPSVINAGDTQVACTMLDISQQGAKMACTHPFAIRQSVRLNADGLPLELPAKVCWRRGDQIGLAFETVFQFFELARIVHELQGGGTGHNELLSAS